MYMLISDESVDDETLQTEHERVNHRDRKSQSSPPLSSQSSGQSNRDTESTDSSEIDVEDSCSSDSSLDDEASYGDHDDQLLLPDISDISSFQPQKLDLDDSANATAFEKMNLTNRTKIDLIITLDGQKLNYVSAQDRFWRLGETTKLQTWLGEIIYDKCGHLFKMLRVQPGFRLEDSDLPVTVDICNEESRSAAVADLPLSSARSVGNKKDHLPIAEAKQVMASAYQILTKMEVEQKFAEEEEEDDDEEFQVSSVTDDVEAFDEAEAEAAEEREEATTTSSFSTKNYVESEMQQQGYHHQPSVSGAIPHRLVKRPSTSGSRGSSSRALTNVTTRERGNATAQQQQKPSRQRGAKRQKQREQSATHWSSLTSPTEPFLDDPDNNNTYGNEEYQYYYSPPKYRTVARGRQGRGRPRGQSNGRRDGRDDNNSTYHPNYHAGNDSAEASASGGPAVVHTSNSSDFLSRSGRYHGTPRRPRRSINGRLPAIKNQSQQQWKRDEHHCYYERDGTSSYAAAAARRDAGTHASGFEQQQATRTTPTYTYTRGGRGHGRGRQTPTSTNNYRSNRFQRQISYSHYDY
jgi:hypothetical protein